MGYWQIYQSGDVSLSSADVDSSHNARDPRIEDCARRRSEFTSESLHDRTTVVGLLLTHRSKLGVFLVTQKTLKSYSYTHRSGSAVNVFLSL
jgi:hypothetical protein